MITDGDHPPLLTDSELSLLRDLINQGFEIEYTPFLDGFGCHMWRVHEFWDEELPGAAKKARAWLQRVDDLQRGSGQ